MKKANIRRIIFVAIVGGINSIALAQQLVPHTLLSSTPPEMVSDNDAFVRISRSDSRYFELSNSKTFIPIGPNICFPRFETEEEKVFALYEAQFKKLHDNGGNYTRVWLSAPFWEVEHEQAGKYDPEIVARLNRLLELAEKYQIKIKFCLEHFRKIEQGPPSALNLIPFSKHIYADKHGGPLPVVSDFFNTKTGRELFLNRTKFLAGLYGTNSQVFAWELWNEINAVGSDSDYIQWTETMLKELRPMFPQSMIVQSMGSFDRENVRDMYRRLTTMPGNDIAQIHRYLDPAAELEICRGPMDLLAADTITELQKYNEDKPVLLAEIGAVEYKHAGPSVLYKSDKEGTLLHDSLFAPFFSGAAGPGQPWHWTYYIDLNDIWWQFGRFAEAIKNFDPVAEKVVPIRLDQQHFRAYALKGKNTVLIWIRDMNSNWKTELVEKINPPVNQGITFDCWPMHTAENTKVSIYDPWTNKWTPGELISNKISLPPFIRSLVIKIETVKADR